jgi:hypothetical protein
MAASFMEHPLCRRRDAKRRLCGFQEFECAKDDDQQLASAEIERQASVVGQQFRQHADDGQIGTANDGDARLWVQLGPLRRRLRRGECNSVLCRA